MTEPRRRTKRTWSRRLLLLAPRTVYGGLVLVCLAVLVPLTAVNTVRLVRTWPPRTNQVLLGNCGYCHSPYRPQHYIKSADMWRRTVRRMVERNGAPVDDETAEEVITWLQDYRGFSDAWIFKAKCERCHARGHLVETPRTAEEWRWTVERVGWLSTFAYRADQTAQIERFLEAEMSSTPPPEGTPERSDLDARLELQDSCNPCHSLSLILEEGAMDDPRAMVERMSSKSAEFVPPDRIDALTEALEALPQDPETFWRLFPHDILLDLD